MTGSPQELPHSKFLLGSRRERATLVSASTLPSPRYSSQCCVCTFMEQAEKQNPHGAELGTVLRRDTHGNDDLVECSTSADKEHDLVNAPKSLCSQPSQRISLLSAGQVGEWAPGRVQLARTWVPSGSL